MKCHGRYFVIFAFLLSAFLKPGLGAEITTYYVSPAGSDKNDGSAGKVWCHPREESPVQPLCICPKKCRVPLSKDRTFSLSSLSYNIMLPYGSKSVPGFVAKPDDSNARVSVNRATSLYGGIEERTTTITVVAEVHMHWWWQCDEYRTAEHGRHRIRSEDLRPHRKGSL